MTPEAKHSTVGVPIGGAASAGPDQNIFNGKLNQSHASKTLPALRSHGTSHNTSGSMDSYQPYRKTLLS